MVNRVVGTIDVESERPDAFDPAAQTQLEECAKALRDFWQDRSVSEKGSAPLIGDPEAKYRFVIQPDFSVPPSQLSAYSVSGHFVPWLFSLSLAELALAMRKALIFTIAALCAVVGFHYLSADFFSIADTSSTETGPMADMDQPLPHAVLPSLDNDWVDLSTYNGQVVLIVFWTTWCPGCVDEVPTLIRLQQEFSGKGFTVLAIAVDDDGEESVESFVENKRFPVNGASASINYPVLLSSDETARKLGFEGGLPAGVLVNRNGREVKIIRGAVSEAALSKAIQRLVRN